MQVPGLLSLRSDSLTFQLDPFTISRPISNAILPRMRTGCSDLGPCWSCAGSRKRLAVFLWSIPRGCCYRYGFSQRSRRHHMIAMAICLYSRALLA